MTAAATYADHTHWLRYQPFFPARARITDQDGPVEEHWAWQGAQIHLDRYARPDAPVKVILLHGAGANGRIMGPFGVLLRQHGYAAVAPDLPGYGLTQAPGELIDYTRWIALVCDLIDAELARDGQPVVLFGASLGGMLAYQVAVRHPAVAGLIATTLADMGDPETQGQLARHPLQAALGRRLLHPLRRLLDRIPVPIRWFSRMDAISNRPELARLVVADRGAGGSWVPLRLLRTLMAVQAPIPPEQFTRCPVLVVHPAEDRMTPLAATERFLARLAAPHTLVLLDGAGHMPLEQPGIAQLEEAVLRFLAERAAP